MTKATTRKSILLAATALAVLGGGGAARAQSAPGAAVVFLPQATPLANDCTARNGADTKAGAISANGTIVAGVSGNVAGCAIRWTNGVPSVAHNHVNDIPDGNNIFEVNSLSGDGRVIVGQYSGSVRFTNYWTPTDLLQTFADPSLNEAIYDEGFVDNNGTFFALTSTPVTPSRTGFAAGRNKAYRWSSAGGYLNLGTFGATWDMVSRGISGTGDVVVGNGTDTASFASGKILQRAFVWRSGIGLAQLPDLSSSPHSGTLASYSEANDVSRDGSTIVGASLANDGFFQAVYWRGGAITGLGYLPSAALPTVIGTREIGTTEALAANADGSIIVGRSIGAANNLAWRWTAASGMQDLNLFATNAGINLSGYVLTDAVGLSDNGQYITGNSFNAAQGQFLGYVLQLAQITQSRLIVTIRLPGVTQTSIVNQTFNTQVDGLLNGANVFTRTVTDPINGAGGVTALADARSALQVGSGLRRVVIGAPVLISNVTTVLGTTNAVVDVASGTATSTATVNTFGPAVVATGDLGTCATAAANNVNPTGCSLPGTPVTVDAGILNSNVFTNTLNSVTPTTTPTVNQLITAKWQVSATAGNQFGTVHAIAGVAAFDRGDRLIGQLLGMGGGASDAAANGITRADMPMRDAHGFGEQGGGLSLFGGYFGNWSRIDADASVPVANVRGNSNGFVLGLEQALGDGRIGLAMDHGSSNVSVRDPAYPETLAFKHTQIALFVGWASGGFSLDGAASYGFGTARTSLTTPTTPAIGSRDVQTWSLGAQGGYTVPLGTSASISPHAGIRHVSANLDRFTEVGGPSPLLGRDQTVTRTRIYAGAEAQAGIALGGITLTPRIHARIARDSGDARGTADLVFANTPSGPVMQALGPGVGRTVAELGGSIDAAVSDTAHLWIGYDGAFRHGARSHTANAGVSVRW